MVTRVWLLDFGGGFSFCESFGSVSFVWDFDCTSLIVLFWLRDFGGGFTAWLCEFGCVSLARVSWLCGFWCWF